MRDDAEDGGSPGEGILAPRPTHERPIFVPAPIVQAGTLFPADLSSADWAGVDSPAMPPGFRIPLVAVALAALVVIGVLIGVLLRPAGPTGLAPSGSLIEVHTADGTVYLGDLVDDADGYLRLEAPAVVLPEVGDDGEASYRVVRLDADPYGLVGPVIIPREQAMLIGAVGAGSSIERAYLDALAGATPSASPAAS